MFESILSGTENLSMYASEVFKEIQEKLLVYFLQWG